MDDRITRIERLAALHRDGALSDDEFRDEKLRVLSERPGAAAEVPEPEPEPEPIAASAPPLPPPLPSASTPVFFEATGEPDANADPDALAPEKRSIARWWLGGTAVAVAALAGAIWYASSIEVADVARSSIGTAAPRVAAAPAPVVEEPVDDGPTDVSDALAFANPDQCEFGGEGRRAFEALLFEQDGEWVTNGPVTLGALSLTPQLEVARSTSDDGRTTASSYASARAPEGVLWNGLKLSRLVHSVSGSDGTDALEERSITFLEDPERVGRVLRRLGVSEGDREWDDRSCDGSLRIEAIPGGSALVCQWEC